MNQIKDRLEIACEIARNAGEYALDYFKDFASLTIQSKGVQDMASEADVNTENLIRAAVSKHFPGDAFLGEESAASFTPSCAQGTWIIDPIDGTQPFLNGIPSWCISIAYVEGNEIKVGVVFDAVSNELFAASAGNGATLNGKPSRCSSATSLSDGLVGVGYSNRVPPEATLDPLHRLLHAHGMYHRSGSGALSLAYVGAGRLIGYFEPHMNSWDFAAGALLIRESGGRTNDCLPNENAIIKGGLMLAAADGVFDELSSVIYGP